MKQETIKTAKYSLIIDESEIKSGDWYFWKVTNSIQKAMKDSFGRLPTNKDGSNKIIAHLPIGDSPILDGVPLINN